MVCITNRKLYIYTLTIKARMGRSCIVRPEEGCCNAAACHATEHASQRVPLLPRILIVLRPSLHQEAKKEEEQAIVQQTKGIADKLVASFDIGAKPDAALAENAGGRR